MADSKELKRAGYISRGDNSGYTGKQCGFMCEYSFILQDEKGSCRYCERFRMPVGDHDSCKFYKDKSEFFQAMDTMAELLK